MFYYSTLINKKKGFNKSIVFMINEIYVVFKYYMI